MKVATYTDSALPEQGSVVAHGVLLLTILLGTGVVPTVASFFGGFLPQIVTPLWLMLYAAAFFGLMFKHGINWITWLARYRILLVILLLGTVASVFWSIEPRVSTERIVHLIGSSLVAIYIGFSVPLLSTLRLFAIVLAIMILASIGAALGLPAMGIEAYEGTQVWRGVFTSKNGLGFWSAVGVLLYISISGSYPAVSTKVLCFLMAALCLGVLALSQSATSLVAMLIAGALSSYIYITIRFELGLIRMSFLAIMFVAITALAVNNIDTTELVGRTGDLTGRGEVWEQVLKLIYQLPFTGTGYGTLWFPSDETIYLQQSYFDFTWVVYHAHNGLLQVASEIGIPLALVALLMVSQQLIEIFYCQYARKQAGVLFVLAFVVTYLISNYSEARFLTTRELFWIFYMALPISMLRQINVASNDEVYIDRTARKTKSRAREASAYAGVPGKPWLGPSPREVTAGDHLPSRAQNTAHLGHDGAAVDTETNSDQYELVTSTLSLTEADLDLGDSGDDFKMQSTLNNTLDLTESGNVYSSEGEVIHAQVSEFDAESSGLFDKDDTFEVDRYDIELNANNEWVDIDLDKKI